MSSDGLIEFEERGWDELIDKFLKIKQVRELWEDFVYNEYQDSCHDIERDDI